MTPLVSIIMGSTSDLPILSKAADFLEKMEVPFEMNALSAHRTPDEVERFARGARDRGLKVIIAAAGMAAALLGGSGQDALYSIVMMPPGVSVATVGINAGLNAAVMAVQILALEDKALAQRFDSYRESLKEKIVKANQELDKLDYKFKSNEGF